MTTSSGVGALVEIDQSACEGHALCEQAAPDVYYVDDEGMVQLRQQSLTAAQITAAEAGARVCPVAALRVRHGD